MSSQPFVAAVSSGGRYLNVCCSGEPHTVGERERVSGGLQGPAWERSESGRVGTAMGQIVTPAWRDPRWDRLGCSSEEPQVRAGVGETCEKHSQSWTLCRGLLSVCLFWKHVREDEE